MLAAAAEGRLIAACGLSCCAVVAWPARGRQSRSRHRKRLSSPRSPQPPARSRTHCTEQRSWELPLLLPSSALGECGSAWLLACGAEHRSRPPRTAAGRTRRTAQSLHWPRTERRRPQWEPTLPQKERRVAAGGGEIAAWRDDGARHRSWHTRRGRSHRSAMRPSHSHTDRTSTTSEREGDSGTKTKRLTTQQ